MKPKRHLPKRPLVLLLLLLLSLPGSKLMAGETNKPPISIKENILMLYYKDITEVVPFYEQTLGLAKTFDQEWVKIYQLSATSSIGVIQAGEKSFHQAQAENAVMLSIVTEDVDAWYERLKQNKEIVFLKEIANSENVPIRGFLVEDPGGYTVEFFQWLDTAEQ